MYQATQEANLPDHEWAGGLHHDEVIVQQDKVVDMAGGTPTLVCLVDMGKEIINMRTLKQGGVKQEKAIEVIQFIFVGYTGFRFQVCVFPTHGIKTSESHICIWVIIAKLSHWGLPVDFVQQYGEENRNFIKSHFVVDPCYPKYIQPKQNVISYARFPPHYGEAKKRMLE